MKATVNAEVTKRIAALSQTVPYLRPWLTSTQVAELIGYKPRTVNEKWGQNLELKRMGLTRKDGKGYLFKNPEFTNWLHDVYWEELV